MEIGEGIEQAEIRLGKMCNPPGRIDLALVLKHGTPKESVLEGMHWIEGLVSTDFKGSQVRISREGQQEILFYYADHPSPLYIPPYYAVVTFYAKAGIGTRWHFEGWGSCK